MKQLKICMCGTQAEIKGDPVSELIMAKAIMASGKLGDALIYAVAGTRTYRFSKWRYLCH